ncbi:MAG: 50S ribosomal protein L25 [Planctomycetota bacterium]
MSIDGNLKVTKREGKGTRACDKVRAAGSIPAIVYGLGKENVCISVPLKEFLVQLDHGVRHFNLDLEGETLDVIVKEVQYGTYDHIVLHADFELVDANKLLHVHADIELSGTAPGEKMGGVVELELHEVAIECKVADIPGKVLIPVDSLELGGVIHISDLPEIPGVKIMNAGDTPVVACHKAKTVEVAAEEGAEEEVSE